MWQLFCEKNPDLKVSKSFYWNHFKTNFNLWFGRPQVGTCCTCEELNLRLKSPHLNNVAKKAGQTDLDVHNHRSNKFFNALKHETSENGLNEEHILSLAFDYVKTISLLKIPVQQLYYMRHLSVNIFSIHNIKEEKSHVYIYHEGQGRKGSNEVATFLNDYLISVPSKYNTLRLFCDNCSGQNKNQTLSRFCLYLTDSGRFDKVKQFFPIRGHSFLPCDRDFGIISSVLKTHDRLYHMHQLTELIISSSRSQKFTVKEIVDATEFFDFKAWSSKHYKKSCISSETKGKNTSKEKKVHFSISNLFHFVYEHDKKGYIKAFTNINGLVCHFTFFMSKHMGTVAQVDSLAYPSGKVTLKKAKVEDLNKLKEFIPEEFNEFYNELYSWPTNECEILPDSDFEEELD
ncbi:uncharacterized protein LOC124812316 [Hydra vulgaris]|uniref:uncharacterized protein LOC124812316 n=1 Tax=Hydra vulgaris TaxID=6087 RepID=UPI001F5E70AF|nr:uncharacterized protein LOC124812316 [Hydra vulgaris]